MSFLDKIIVSKKKEKTAKPTVEKESPSPRSAVVKNDLSKKSSVKRISAVGDKSTVAKQILLRPLISEKSTFLKTFNQYVFEVHPQVNKIEIKQEVKKVYKVDPVRVNIIKLSGKNVRYGRNIGKRKGWKKAVVTLKDGQSINLS